MTSPETLSTLPCVSPSVEPALLMRDITRRFGPVRALNGLSWTALPGQITCVLGPNGAGKTTAVEIAVGLQAADSGLVRVLGVDPWHSSATHRARVGVMLQDGGLPQAVRPVQLLRHLSRFWADPLDVDMLVTRLGIHDFARTTIRRLSGGQRQRVALAAALIGRPDIVFLDEPTAGLDPHARREVHRILSEIAQQGTALVVTTHAFEEAERLADQIVVIAAGRALATGTVQQVAGEQGLEQTYFELTDRQAS